MQIPKPPAPFTRDDLAVIARLLREEQDHAYRDGYTWGPGALDRVRWMRRVRRVARKVQAHQIAARPAPPIPF